jgi:hypothetical protein
MPDADDPAVRLLFLVLESRGLRPTSPGWWWTDGNASGHGSVGDRHRAGAPKPHERGVLVIPRCCNAPGRRGGDSPTMRPQKRTGSVTWKPPSSPGSSLRAAEYAVWFDKASALLAGRPLFQVAKPWAACSACGGAPGAGASELNVTCRCEW